MHVVTVLTVLLGAGCVVYPHEKVEVPAVEGRVLLNGAPVPEAVVRYGADPTVEDCDPEQGRALTGLDGRFSFEGRTEEAWVQLLPPFLCVNRRMICIETSEGRRVQWKEGSRGLCRQPERLDLVCDIAPTRMVSEPACVPAEEYGGEAW